MRESYHAELDGLITDLVAMARDSQVALKDATAALLTADQAIAERVIADDVRIDDQAETLENRAFNLLARQSPVAGELRTVVAVLRMTFELSRMGDLAAHVAKISRMRFPEKAVPSDLEANFARMAEVADEMITVACSTLESRDAHAARELAEKDEEMDSLRRDQFKLLLGDDWNHGVEKAVDVALLGRYYERIADHAVAMGRRIILVLTGDVPEGENWPTTY
ncbi:MULTISPECIES: phosphate signaling complex protein PhoU [Aestuariimicrobium]|uniref:phosphate signaling complex protein PhoU n=1 Tax=Aestuariimicrobium TaxID=396388 RepID=UPI0003B593E9|nr:MULTISPECIES: phosphate signaling complex protein PhoU [Aestuariimicrobium]CAI9401270.1 Phosphate-specific transport system accessory protein PhoU [Aestuariimicrobium sp. T2.26MG-19.2B]